MAPFRNIVGISSMFSNLAAVTSGGVNGVLRLAFREWQSNIHLRGGLEECAVFGLAREFCSVANKTASVHKSKNCEPVTLKGTLMSGLMSTSDRYWRT